MTPNKSSFVVMYSDDSGIEYGVHYNTHPTPEVTLESQGQEIAIDPENLGWFVEALQQVFYYYEAHLRDNGGQ